MDKTTFRIAFISGKLGDVDGVSLEVDKWIKVLMEQGHEVFTIAGRYGHPVELVPQENQILVEKISFESGNQKHYEHLVFPYLNSRVKRLTEEQTRDILKELDDLGNDVASELFDIIREYSIDVIIPQNLNAMPMSLLGGIGVYKLITEKRIAAIFHHHDFWWERSRFSDNAIEPLLNKIMPPTDVGVEHVVISSYAEHILRSFKRVQPIIVPNCEDFEEAPVRDRYNESFRKDLGFKADDILIVQPTRIVPRKRIEDSVRLVSRCNEVHTALADRVQFVISLYQGDELDSSYIDDIQELASRLNVRLHLISDRIASLRGRDKEGRKLYTNRDVLVNADIVTYLPLWEGFGNALLEAIAARVPVVTTTYLVYKTDIKSAGFENIEIRDSYNKKGHLIIPDRAVMEMREFIEKQDIREEMVTHNFELGKQEFGFSILRSRLNMILEDYGDEIKASRKRLQKSFQSYYV